MADPKYQKYRPLTTPKGIAIFPWITKPDVKFNSDGTYHTSLKLDPKAPGVAEFLDRIRTITKESAAAVKESGVKKVAVAPPIVEELDDDENPTGFVIIKSKTNATRKGRDGKSAPHLLTIVDAKRNPHPGNIPVYGGSILKLNVTPVPRYVQGKLYVTLYINAVQVLDLQTGGGNVDGFFDEEDGYEASESTESAFADESDDTAEEGEEEDLY